MTPGPDPVALAYEHGFALAGVAPATATPHRGHVEAWLAEGRHGEMAYLQANLALRLDPAAFVPGGRSVLVVADAYPAGFGEPTDDANRHEPEDTPPRGRVARYAWGDDYHLVMKKRLHALADALRERHPGATLRCCVDTAPLLEREHAAHAGLGWVGKHTLLIHPFHGSFLLLGAVVTDLDWPPSRDDGFSDPLVPPTDRCGTCTRCVDACPTGCIFDDRRGRYPGDASSVTSHPARDGEPTRAVDASRCISYLTLEHRSAISPGLHADIGDWLAGCDVCQTVCPYNAPAPGLADATPVDPPPRHPLPVRLRYRPRPEFARGLDPWDVLEWTEDDRRAAFRGSALKRVKLGMLHRNALIVLTNHAAARPPDDPDRGRLTDRLAAIADDPERLALARDTARQCLARLHAPVGPAADPPV